MGILMPRSTAATTIAIAISLGRNCTGDSGGVGAATTTSATSAASPSDSPCGQ